MCRVSLIPLPRLAAMLLRELTWVQVSMSSSIPSLISPTGSHLLSGLRQKSTPPLHLLVLLLLYRTVDIIARPSRGARRRSILLTQSEDIIEEDVALGRGALQRGGAVDVLGEAGGGRHGRGCGCGFWRRGGWRIVDWWLWLARVVVGVFVCSELCKVGEVDSVLFTFTTERVHYHEDKCQ